MPSRIDTTKGPSKETKLLKESTCYFDLSGAEAAGDFSTRTSLSLSKGEYYIKCQGKEIHIYGVKVGIDSFNFGDPSESGPIQMRPDGIEVKFNRSDVSSVVLHRDPLGKSPKDLAPPAIDRASLPFASELREIYDIKAKAGGKLTPDQLQRVKDLLERIQTKSNELKQAKVDPKKERGTKKAEDASARPTPARPAPTGQPTIPRPSPAPAYNDPFSSRSSGGG